MPQQQAGFGQHPAFGGFINDPSAQLGLQMGQTAFNAGQQYIDQNVCPYSPRGLPWKTYTETFC